MKTWDWKYRYVKRISEIRRFLNLKQQWRNWNLRYKNLKQEDPDLLARTTYPVSLANSCKEIDRIIHSKKSNQKILSETDYFSFLKSATLRMHPGLFKIYWKRSLISKQRESSSINLCSTYPGIRKVRWSIPSVWTQYGNGSKHILNQKKLNKQILPIRPKSL